MVDGFGVTGVDGTFRRCSEHTLRVLRGSAELIMTVLEVFKHDPLYAWCVNPLLPSYSIGFLLVAALALSTRRSI
jgi:ataxia telangiectasia mutated family protein